MPTACRSIHLRHFFGTCSRRVLLLAFLLLPVVAAVSAEGASEDRWFKGTTHSHSFWSDGDQFPDMVVDWFKSRDYDFFSLTDHNRIMEGNRWVKLVRQRRPISEEVLQKYIDRFGADWVEVRGEGSEREVRLKTFQEIEKRFAEPGRFLLIQGEEITDRSKAPSSRCVHINALNLVKLIRPQSGDSAIETMRRDIAAADEQARQMRRPILTHVNHPNFGGYSITARDLAEVPEVRFLEICNNHNGVCHYGDKNHPSVERLWDLANTLRLIEKKVPPIYGVASDDSHNYHTKSPSRAIPGRGWIVVRARRLETRALLRAMAEGDFYSSTGVELAELDYNPRRRTLHVEVVPKPDTHYTIEFIGTPADLTLPDDKALDKTA
ncbi:MAG: hypothetical protein JW888_05340, partial [Pirellulales bacterium]|nr:hypothetical protein [Pirellulales bacterium]